MAYFVDLAAWPLVRLRIVGPLEDDEVDAWVELTTREFPGRNEPYAVVIDLLDAGVPSARFVRKQAAGQKAAEAEIVTYCRGIAFVLDTPFLRGALKAILHIAPLPTPQLVASEVDEALIWARSQLAGA